MGQGLQRVVRMYGGLSVFNNQDMVVYGPNTSSDLTTAGLQPNDSIQIVGGQRPFAGRIVRIMDDKIAIVVRLFHTSGKLSKPYKVHISAIERIPKE